MSAREQSEESSHKAKSANGNSLSDPLPGLASALPRADDPSATLQLLETIIASMTEAVIVADAQGNLILHNPASLTLHGYETRSEALGSVTTMARVWQVSDLAGNPLPVSAWPLTRALRSEQFNGYEVRVRRTDTGKHFVGSYSGTAIRDESGAVRYALITIRDISEQKEAEERMRESEARFRSVLERSLDAAYRRDLAHDRYDYLSPVIEQITGYSPEEMSAMTMEEVWAHIAYCDNECHFRLVNRSYAERFGLTPADLAGKHVREVLGEPAYETVRPYIEVVLGGRAVEFEIEIELPEQGRRHTHGRYAPAVGADGEVNGFVAVISDITEQKRAEAALREREREFTTMANLIPQLAWMTDAEGWIYWYNQRWYDYTGTTLEEVEGWGWQKVHHPDHVDRVVAGIRQAFETGEPWEDTFPLHGKDGEYR